MRIWGLLFLVLIVFVSGCIAQIEQASETSASATEKSIPEEIVADEKITEYMTFTVTVPENTPENDLVNIIFYRKYPDGMYLPDEKQMEKIGPRTYQVNLTREELGFEGDWNKVDYIYNRNGWGEITTEYLPLKPEDKEPGNPFEYRNAQRETDFELGKVQQDTIRRWRWFPDGPLQTTSDLEPQGEFLPRLNGAEFRSGQGIQDLFIDDFRKFYNSTAEHMVEIGYNWVAFYPPWQWYNSNPPKVGNTLELGISDAPNYPNDEELIRQIRAYKKAGLKVYLEPQICCTQIEMPRTRTNIEAYNSEVERFILHHAKLAEEAGVDALLVDPYGIDEESRDEKMREIIQEVREVYSGELSAKVAPFLADVETATQTIPQASEVPWVSEVDFFMYDAEGELSPKENPTDDELKEGAGEVLDLMRPFYQRYNKPVMVRTSYFGIKQSWRGPEFYHKGNIPGESNAEDTWEFHELSLEDQARVVNAYWRAIAERPWIIGYLQFGYWQWDMPVLPDWGIRGKPAEDVWRRWNEKIYT